MLLSIPLSVLAAFLLLNAIGGTINTMVLGGLALVFSRLIDNSVVVLENIFRHMEEGEDPVTAAERGGQEVSTGGAGRHLHHGHRVLPGRLSCMASAGTSSPRWRWRWCWRWLPRTSSP